MLYSQEYRIWDFWATTDHKMHHLFFLKAPRVGQAQSRHDQAVIGHATSKDWKHWEMLQDALLPSHGPAWDDLSLWTGSVLRGPKAWAMFYTGRDRVTRTQNVGMALSHDLQTWQRVRSEPLFAVDAQWYVTPMEETPETFTWRDPYAVRDPETGLFYIFISAHDRHRSPGYSGAIAACISDDLEHWTMLPPIFSPGWFRDMEVPTVIHRNGVWLLYVSVKTDWYGPSAPYDQHLTTTLCFQSPKILGPYQPSQLHHGYTPELWYASRPVFDRQRGYLLMGWRMGEEEGYPQSECAYGIDDPIALC